jgi:hypothetical protein
MRSRSTNLLPVDIGVAGTWAGGPCIGDGQYVRGASSQLGGYIGVESWFFFFCHQRERSLSRSLPDLFCSYRIVHQTWPASFTWSLVRCCWDFFFFKHNLVGLGAGWSSFFRQMLVYYQDHYKKLKNLGQNNLQGPTRKFYNLWRPSSAIISYANLIHAHLPAWVGFTFAPQREDTTDATL